MINTGISLNDQVTLKLNAMRNALNGVILGFERLESSANLNNASLQGANSNLNQMESNVSNTNGIFALMQSTLTNIASTLDSMRVDTSMINVNLNTQNAILSSTNQRINQVSEETEETAQHEERHTRALQNSSIASSGLLNKIKMIATTYVGMKVLDLSDTLANTSARLNLINDGLQSTAELQEMIYQSANRSKGSYQETAAFVARLGITAKDAFSSTREIAAFAEQVNKQFKLSGANANETSATLLQLAQALGSGVLRGDELNSIFEQAPTLIQQIAKYLGVSIGEIRGMATNGEITAEIVKNALLSTANETNEAFERMPKTFADIATKIKNDALMKAQPILQKLNEIANSDRFSKFADGAINTLSSVFSAATQILDAMVSTGAFLYDNWSRIEPVVIIAVSAMAGYKLALMAVNTWNAIAAAGELFRATCTGIATGATLTAEQAQLAFNLAILKCPWTWVAMLLMGAVIAIGLWVKKVGNAKLAWLIFYNNVMTTLENLDLWFKTILANINNGLDNFVLAAFNAGTGVANAFTSMKANVLSSVQNMVNGSINLINKLISGLNKIPGVNMPTIANVSFGDSAQTNAQATIAQRNANLQGYYDVVAQNKADRAKNLSRLDDLYGVRQRTRIGQITAFKNDIASKEPTGNDSFADMYQNSLDNLSAISNGVDKTAKNTGDAAKSLAGVTEDLKYIRDVAEKEVINRFLGATINVDMQNSISSNNAQDIDGVITRLGEKMRENLNIAMEGL